MVKTLELILDLVVFQISGMEFCAKTENVIAIMRPDELSYTLGTEQKHLPTIIRDKREFLFTDLRKTFNLQSEKFTTDTRAILMEMNNIGLIFFVDRVVEIISIEQNNEISAADFQEMIGIDFIDRILIYENRKFLLPDYHKILLNIKTGD